MPLYKTITVSDTTKVLIWKIEESLEWLSNDIELTEHCNDRVSNMKSMIHQRGFMSVRHLLKAAGYTDFDLYYDSIGKPHLKDGKKISITHSFTFSGIIISDTEVGIDIEMQRPKILKIAHKFTPVEEYLTLANEDARIRKLTMVWCAKESIYKSFATKGVRFLNDIFVEDYRLEQLETRASVNFKGRVEDYQVWFKEFEGFTLGYALSNTLPEK